MILHENDMGYLSKCVECGELHLHIGNVFSKLKYYQLKNLKKAFIRFEEEFGQHFCELPNGDKILVKTNTDDLFIGLDYQELRLVMEILEIGDLMYEASERLIEKN